MTTTVLYLVGGAIVLVTVVMSGEIVLRTWRHRGSWRLLDRWDALHRFANALFMAVVALLAVSWALFPPGLWYLPAALLAAAAAGTVLRWPELAWKAGDGKAATRRTSAFGTLAFAAGAIALLAVALV
jgi:hypothetical protein